MNHVNYISNHNDKCLFLELQNSQECLWLWRWSHVKLSEVVGKGAAIKYKTEEVRDFV